MHQEQEILQISRSSNINIEILTDNVEENDVCVYWYFGSHGLKEGAVDFYKEHISSNICKRATPCLVDLTAWGCFQSDAISATKFNKNVEQICSSPLFSYKTSSFFAELKSVDGSNGPLFLLLENILHRQDLMEISGGYTASGRSLSSAIGEDVQLISGISTFDTSICYSIFQYIEFLYITKSILQNKPDARRIRFHLPNDENKYYPESLTHDLCDFLKAYNVSHNHLEIHIDCFDYGTDSKHRPYNAPGKVIKKKLEINDVINEAAAAEIKSRCEMII